MNQLWALMGATIGLVFVVLGIGAWWRSDMDFLAVFLLSAGLPYLLISLVVLHKLRRSRSG